MNEYQKWIRFAEGVTLREVNPDDVALKCPYMNNLFVTCMNILPRLNEIVSNIEVVKGFTSEKKLKLKIANPSPEELLFTKGLAIELTWPGYNSDKAISICKELFEQLSPQFKLVVREGSVLYMYDKESALVQEYFEKNILKSRVILK